MDDGCFAVNIRQKKRTPLTAEMTMAVVTARSNQSFDGPSSSAYSAAPRKLAIASRLK
jgi:hypothetical protein